MYVCMYVCTHLHICICMYVCMYVYVYVCMCLCVYAYTHTHTDTHIHTCTCVYEQVYARLRNIVRARAIARAEKSDGKVPVKRWVPCLPSFNVPILSYFLFTYSHRKPASKCWADDVEAQGVYRHCNDSALARCQGVRMRVLRERERARERASEKESKSGWATERERTTESE